MAEPGTRWSYSTGNSQILAEILRRRQKIVDGQPFPPVLLVVNKCESLTEREAASQFYELGLGDPHPISAVHGTDTGDLLETVTLTAIPSSTRGRISLGSRIVTHTVSAAAHGDYLKLGASAFLRKPVSRQAFLEALDQQVTRLVSAPRQHGRQPRCHKLGRTRHARIASAGFVSGD